MLVSPITAPACGLHPNNAPNLFCLTCQTPICTQCTVLGPHHTQLHLIQKIDQAYVKIVGQLGQRISSLVQSSRAKSQVSIQSHFEHLQSLNQKVAKVKQRNSIFQSQILSELQSVFDRNLNTLRVEEETLVNLTAELSHLAHKYQSFEAPIDRVASYEGLVLAIERISDKAERAIQIPQVKLNSLPRHMVDMRLAEAETSTLQGLIKQKHMLLATMIGSTRKALSAIPIIALPHNELLNQLNQYLSEVSQQPYLLCCFCSLGIDTFLSTNQPCSNNRGHNPDFKGNFQLPQTNNVLNTGRHFFGKGPRRGRKAWGSAIEFFAKQCVNKLGVLAETEQGRKIASIYEKGHRYVPELLNYSIKPDGQSVSPIADLEPDACVLVALLFKLAVLIEYPLRPTSRPSLNELKKPCDILTLKYWLGERCGLEEWEVTRLIEETSKEISPNLTQGKQKLSYNCSQVVEVVDTLRAWMKGETN